MARPKSQFCKHGHDTNIYGRDSRNACNDCKRQWSLENSNYYKEYFQEHRDILLAKMKDYRTENGPILALKQKEWWDNHREQKAEIDRQYFINNREKCLAYNIKNQTNRNLREVAWTDWDNIIEFYKNKPDDMVGDHYIPLQGKKVSGLHVSWNLQCLTQTQNARKHNKCNLLEVSEWYGKLLEEAGLK
jgi:hypothetical protein